MTENILWFKDISMNDVDRVGGKNASLGEMYNQLSQADDILVPNGFATTTAAFHLFLRENGLDQKINKLLQGLDVDNIPALSKTGEQIRTLIMQGSLPKDLADDLTSAWQQLAEESEQGEDFAVAVRSSATAEDLPDASFAGQQETFLNVQQIDNVLQKVKAVFASLYTNRAISYRVHQGFDHCEVGLSCGIQHMVRSDLASSGVMFSIDTESGFEDVVFITSAYGLGETVVQGAVNPDEFYVFKPNIQAKRPAVLQRKLGTKAIKMVYADSSAKSAVKTVDVAEKDQLQFSLTDSEIESLARQAMLIESHYKRPMDIEWAKDGANGKLYIVQARPETVQSKRKQSYERYQLNQKGPLLAEGRSIGQGIGNGIARVIKDISEMDKVKEGDVLVTDMTDPDWEPVMKRASAIITNRGGRTCHAAIIAREFNVPAVVGTENATQVIKNGSEVTVSCAEGDTGYVYEGKLDYSVKSINVGQIPNLPVKIMMNVGNPERAFSFAKIPNQGVGLARMEFIISNTIGVHPQALLDFDQLPADVAKQVTEKTSAYASPTDFYIDKLAEGIATIAAAFYPKPVIVRLSDFKSNEYKNLIGGDLYEPVEENPMLGFRGASRYIAESFKASFALECEAIKKVRDVMGLINVEIMIPFVRTPKEAKATIAELSANGLERGKNNLRIIMMCEIPSNAILADEFLQYCDGFSIGSNDLTQLTLGLDRDSGLIAESFDERDLAVKFLLQRAIAACRKQNKYIGICGQGPSDHPDFAKWLLDEGIESISLIPDTVLETMLFLSDEEMVVS